MATKWGSSGRSSGSRWGNNTATVDAPVTADPGIEAEGESPYTEKLTVNKKALAQNLMRLYNAGDVEGYKQTMASVGQVFTPAEMKAYGLDRIAVVKSGGNFLGKPKEGIQKATAAVGSTAAGKLLGKAIEKLDAPRTVATAGLRQGLWGLGNVAEKVSGGRIQGGVEGGWQQFREDLGSHVDLGDIFNSADENLAAKGATPIVGAGARKPLQKSANVAGYVVLDPLTAVGGPSQAVKSSMARISAEVGEATAKKIAVHGLGNAVEKGIISEAEHQAVLATLRAQADELVGAAAEGGVKRGLLPGTVRRQTADLAMAGDSEALAARALRGVERQGRAGLKVGIGEGKRTLIPSYIEGRSVLNPRQYTADIMGRGAKAAAETADELAFRAAPIVEETPGLRAGLDAANTLANNDVALYQARRNAKVGEVMHIPAGASPTGDDMFLLVGERNGAKSFEAVLQIGDDKVKTLFAEPGARGGVSKKLYAKAEEAGYDIAKLGTEDMTQAGRAARESYLAGKSPAATVDQAIKRGERGTGLQALPQTAAQPSLLGEPVESAPAWLHARAGVERRTPLDVLRQSGVGQAVGKAFAPRSAVRAELGELAERGLYRGQETAGATISQKTHDLWLQLGKTSDKGIKALEDGAGAALEAALPSLKGLKGREAFNEMMTAVAEQRLSPDTIRLIEQAVHGKPGAITRAADAIADAAARGGVEAADERQLAAGIDAKPTVSKILSPAGEEIARGKAGGKLREALGLKEGEELKAGSNLTKEAVKVMQSEKGIKALNDALVERLGIAPDTRIFHEDVVASVALRSRASFEAAAMTEMYQGLAKQMIDHDTPLLTIVQAGDKKAAKAAADRGWIKLPGKQPTVGDIYGPEAAMKELAKIQDIVINDEALAGFRKFLDGWNGMWASYATNPLPFGLGFHSRNAIGNVILTFLGGLTNPAKFVESANVQRSLAKVRRLMTKEGLSFEAAMDAASISDYSKYVIRNGREHGIISAGFFADLDNYDLDRILGDQTFRERAATFAKDNKLLRANRKVGDVVENNARLALFMDSLEKTGSVTHAADTVKKYLFDYADLTPFERRNMKAINRFYTFMRKNTAVQLYALAHDPWKQKMILQAESTLYRDDPSAPIPDYAQRGGYNVSRMLSGGAGTQGIAMNIETPLDSAIKTLDPLVQAATMVPGIRNVLPPQYRSDKQQLTSAILNSRSGGPQEFVNFLFETATGKDTFSGKDISEESGGETFSRLANAFLPLYGKAQRGLGGQVTGETRQPGMTARLELMQALTGINVLPLTDKQRNQIAYVASQDLQNALDKLKAEGVDVPTYTELVRLGLAPDLSAPKDKNAKKRTPEQVTKDAQSKVNAARAALGAEPVTTTGLRPTASSKKNKWG